MQLEQPKHDGVLVPAKAVRERFGNIADMTLYRWSRDERLQFPEPIRINGRRYWRLADIVAWEAGRANASTSEAAR